MPEALIASNDWRGAAELVVPFAYDDEHLGSGYVHLVVGGGTAVWSARNETDFARLTTPGEGGPLEVLLAPRLVTAAASLASRSGVVTLSQRPDDTVLLTDGEVHYEIHPLPVEAPNVAELLEACAAPDSVGVDVSLEDLSQIVATATQSAACNQRRDEEPPPLWLEVGPDRIALSVHWPGLGPATYSASAVADGSCRVTIPPWSLRQFTRALDAEQVHLDVPRGEGGMLCLRTGNWVGGSVAHHSSAESYRTQVERVLVAAFPNAPRWRDEDGDYVLPARTTPTYARLVDGPPRLQVFAIALRDAQESPGLLAELNHLNGDTSLVRVFLDGSTVLVEGQVLCDSLAPAAVAAVHREVDHVASEIAPLLAAMFGGTAGTDAPLGAEWTWQRYVETIIATEVAPGRWVELNGPNAEARLPFPEPIHVVTAANPSRQRFGEGADAEANAALAGELWTEGVPIARAVGRSPDGRHSEASVAVLGSRRADAVALARRYGQEAIFEVTNDAVLVVSCVSDRVSSVPRRPPPRLDVPLPFDPPLHTEDDLADRPGPGSDRGDPA